ncbi:MAG TPA: hypothetical protein VG738_08830 [Chitinophagaceae bacterium]|nr:hypothetical protein [Chitinophagaceae bacterium]
MKARILIIFLLFAAAGHAQQNLLNNYRYVMVPYKYSFSKTDNQYGLSTTTKALLEQKGFVVFFDNDTLPPALAANRCSMLTADVQDNSGMFTTKLTLLLKDCNGRIIFQGKEGKSREKEYYPAYNAALQDAFASLNAMAYKYDGTQPAQQPQATAAVTQPAVAVPQPSSPVVSTPVSAGSSVLYAQPTATGYQLVDTSPKKVLSLFKTSVQDYYIAQAETGSGLVFKRNGEWFYEYYQGDTLVSRKLEIKF